MFKFMKFAYFLAIFVLLTVHAAAVGDERCIQCHTDELILQSLVSVPGKTDFSGVYPSGPLSAAKPETYFRRYLVDKAVFDKDPHFMNGCASCHKGDPKSDDQEKAHRGIIKRPSADLKVCGECHEGIAANFRTSLHYTVRGLSNKFSGRLSEKEKKIFSDKVFAQSCKTCHASCGDCHVSSPSIKGVRNGFIKGHGFVKKDEGKTCAVCHGGSVHPEYIGQYSGSPDAHHIKKMTCTDCHKKVQLHGDGLEYKNKNKVKNRPMCRDCHKSGNEAKTTARLAHAKHEGKVSCYGCHVHGKYGNCYNCHEGSRASLSPGFMLGTDPLDKKMLTTLRAIPITRETFLKSGIKMEKFDEEVDFRAAPVHNIKKSTERTRSCDICHINKKDFLTERSLPKNGSKTNKNLIFKMGPLDMN